MGGNYKTIQEAETAFTEFKKRFEAQGYYSTIRGGERVRIPIDELADYCKLIEL